MTQLQTDILSRRVQEMTESATIKMAEMARKLKSEGKEVIALSLGEPDFDTPQFIKDAAKKALDDGFTKYTPVPGLPVLREAIVNKFSRENNLHFKAGNIVVSNGAKQSIANVCLAMLDPDDEVIILSPYWVSYYEIVRMTGARPVPVHAGIEQDFKITPDQLTEAITPRTKLMIFSSPCNPTGSVYTEAELRALASVIQQHEQLHVVSDEIYEYINFESQHFSIGSIESIADRCITVNGFSKGFAMTGWRLGYMGAADWIAEACNKIQGQFTSGAAAFSQVAAAHALNADRSETVKMREAFLRRRDLTIREFGKIPGFKVNRPTGAFYLFPDVSAYFGKSDGRQVVENADDMSLYLLETAHVATVSGSAFGDDACIRLSYAASDEDIKEACRRIAEAVSRLS